MEHGQHNGNDNLEELVTAREIEGGIIVELHTERFNALNAADIFQFIQSRIIPNSNMIILLDSVNTMDSSGCGCLLKLHRQAKKVDTQFAVVTPSNIITKLLLILRFDRLAPIYKELHEAVEAMKK